MPICVLLCITLDHLDIHPNSEEKGDLHKKHHKRAIMWKYLSREQKPTLFIIGCSVNSDSQKMTHINFSLCLSSMKILYISMICEAQQSFC